eukprot:PhM_4_TR11408/c0_g1_i1/m.71284
MGQGRCLDIFEAGAEFIRCICCMICIAFCAGPVLLIIGIVLVVAPNTRTQRVNEYNDACLSWMTSGSASFAASSFSSDSHTLLGVYNQSYHISGNTDGVKYPNVDGNYYQVTYSQSQSSRGIYSVTSYGSVKTSQPVQTTFNFPATMSGSYDYVCDSSSCYNTGVSVCRSGYNLYVQKRRNCHRGDTCGTCFGNLYLTKVCLPYAAPGTPGSPWAPSTTMSSCDYPFKTQTYDGSSAPTDKFVTVRPQDDPYMTLLRLTDGSRDFGLDRGQQTRLGLTLAVIGGILCGITVCVCVVACGPRRAQANNFVNRVRGRPVYAVQTNNNVQQPFQPQGAPGAYGSVQPQQQQGYPQPGPYQQQPYQQQQYYPQQQQQQQQYPAYPPQQQQGYP